MDERHQNDDLVISYMLMRKILGILGIALPFILCLGSMIFFKCEVIQQSISHYYHTGMKNIFLAVLFMIAFFLFAYKGYDRDYIYTRIAAILAIGVALFPTKGAIHIGSEGLALPDAFLNCVRPALSDNPLYNNIHLICAALLFLMLAFISLFLFTRSKGDKTDMKKYRNLIYKICGCIMILCVILIAIYLYLRNNGTINWDGNYPPVFVLESIALIAFGTSWLIKGEALLGDK